MSNFYHNNKTNDDLEIMDDGFPEVSGTLYHYLRDFSNPHEIGNVLCMLNALSWQVLDQYAGLESGNFGCPVDGAMPMITQLREIYMIIEALCKKLAEYRRELDGE